MKNLGLSSWVVLVLGAASASAAAPSVEYGCWAQCFAYDSYYGMTRLGAVIGKSSNDVLDAYQNMEEACWQMSDDGCGPMQTELVKSFSNFGIQYASPFDPYVCRALRAGESEPQPPMPPVRQQRYCGSGTPLG